MNTICTRCGSLDVSCEAMINPNTNELRNYTDEAFLYGWCDTCGFGSILTDTDEVKSEIKKYFRQFMELHVEELDYAVCDIVWKYSNKIETVKIRLSTDCYPNGDYDVFFYCNSLSELLSLCEYGKADFLVTEIHSFENFLNNNKLKFKPI
ncbi:hypothetical protein [Phocaeicola dorei]|nr:hypothetical protein [Phocaeicola dorei]